MPQNPGPQDPGRVRLLVVYKKSQLQLYHEHQPGAIEALRQRDSTLFRPLKEAHLENARAIARVRTEIEERGIEARFVYRAHHESADGFDLVISVGGDGTLLDVSHHVMKRPLLGVNSSSYSVGHFCATHAGGFGRVLDGWLAGQVACTTLQRLQVAVNGRISRTPVLNDLLLAHLIPAAMSRYIIEVGDVQEEHKSSGIWLSTAAGSSAAIRSAGGTLMEPTDERMQFVVREPYRWAGHPFRLEKGLVDGPIVVTSKMRTGSVYLDGHREQIPLSLGDRVEITRHPCPLQVVGFRRHD